MRKSLDDNSVLPELCEILIGDMTHERFDTIMQLEMPSNAEIRAMKARDELPRAKRPL